MKLFKLLVVIALEDDHCFGTWYSMADNAIHAIEKVKTLLTTALPKAEIYVEVKSE